MTTRRRSATSALRRARSDAGHSQQELVGRRGDLHREDLGMAEGPRRLGVAVEGQVAVGLEDEVVVAEAVLAQQVLGLVEPQLPDGWSRSRSFHRRTHHGLERAEVRVVEQALPLQARDEAEDLAVALAGGADDELGRRARGPHAPGHGIEPRLERVPPGQLQRGQQVAGQILLARQHPDVGVGRRLEVDGDAIGQRARRLDLSALRAREELQVHVPAKAVTAAQDLDRREHAIHGALRTAGHARGEEQAIRRHRRDGGP